MISPIIAIRQPCGSLAAPAPPAPCCPAALERQRKKQKPPRREVQLDCPSRVTASCNSFV